MSEENVPHLPVFYSRDSARSSRSGYGLWDRLPAAEILAGKTQSKIGMEWDGMNCFI